MGRPVGHGFEQAFGAADDVAEVADSAGAFGVNQDVGFRPFLFHFGDGLFAEDFVHFAGALPEEQIPAGFAADPVAKVFVGSENDFAVFGQAVDDLNGVGGGDAVVGEGFDGGGGVDIIDDEVVRMGVDEGFEFIRRGTFGEGAAGGEVGKQHGFVRGKHFGGFRHEVDPAEDNDLGVVVGGFPGQIEAVADEIGNILNFVDLVIMRENDGIHFALEFLNFRNEVHNWTAGGAC